MISRQTSRICPPAIGLMVLLSACSSMQAPKVSADGITPELIRAEVNVNDIINVITTSNTEIRMTVTTMDNSSMTGVDLGGVSHVITYEEVAGFRVREFSAGKTVLAVSAGAYGVFVLVALAVLLTF